MAYIILNNDDVNERWRVVTKLLLVFTCFEKDKVDYFIRMVEDKGSNKIFEGDVDICLSYMNTLRDGSPSLNVELMI